MQSIAFGYFFAFFTAFVVIVGDLSIKVAADGDMPLTSRPFLLGFVLYGVSAVAWYFAVRYVTLAQAGVAFSMVSLLALCVFGALWFEEEIRLREVLGITCALAAMMLMVRFS